jgi:hypothetical protein
MSWKYLAYGLFDPIRQVRLPDTTPPFVSYLMGVVTMRQVVSSPDVLRTSCFLSVGGVDAKSRELCGRRIGHCSIEGTTVSASIRVRWALSGLFGSTSRATGGLGRGLL